MPAPQTLLPQHMPAPDRPLAGLTLLVVEDSRYACEVMRLLCQHSGARLRRADCLAAARRHLRVYCPDVLLVDLGLPDCPGEALIAELAPRMQRPTAILAISGDPTLGPAALAAGADGFVEKPVMDLARFQRAILQHLSGRGAGALARSMPPPDAVLTPDPLALRDDLTQAAGLLAGPTEALPRDYLRGFLGGIARSARDDQLAAAAAGLRETGPEPVGRLARLVRARLDADTLPL